jgi:hypothetical protein
MARKNRIKVFGQDIISLHGKEPGQKDDNGPWERENSVHVFGPIESESSPW